jgi:opacity protein-like surface antigen
VGAGITLHAGRVVADIGYRHHRLFSDTWMDALALDGDLGSNEVRFGIGVSF